MSQKIDHIQAEKYLLGELDAEQKLDFESEVFADEAFSEELEAVREELAEKYLSGELDEKQKENFEKHFLIFSYNAQIFTFQKSLLAEIQKLKSPPPTPVIEEKPGLIARLVEIFTFKNLAIPAFAAILLVMLGIGLFYPRKIDDLVAEVTPTPTIEQTPTVAPSVAPTEIKPTPTPQISPTVAPTKANNSSPNIERSKPVPTPIASPKETIASVLATISLSNNSRDTGSREKPLIVGKETKQAELNFNLPEENPAELANYKLILETVAGGKVWEGNLTKNSPKTVKQKISPSILQTGQYRFRVVGILADGKEETVKSNIFFVKRVS
jgi:hypothetical protein